MNFITFLLTDEAESRLDDLIKSLQKTSTPVKSGEGGAASASSFKPPTSGTSPEVMIPNNQSGLATSTSVKPLPPDNYKNNILKAKSQDENKKVGGNAMLSFSNSSSHEEKSRLEFLGKFFVNSFTFQTSRKMFAAAVAATFASNIKQHIFYVNQHGSTKVV